MNHTERKYAIIRKRLEQEPGQKLQIGSGRMPLRGFTNLDLVPLPGTDVLADLEKPLPFKDNFFDFVYARHCIEHVQNLMPLLEEIHRVTKPTGRIEIEVPHPSFIFMYRDPTHRHFFTLHTFDLFTEGYDFSFYTKVRFRTLSKKIEFTGGRFKILNFLSWIINRNGFTQDLWERFCWWLPMENLFFTLQPVKKENLC